MLRGVSRGHLLVVLLQLFPVTMGLDSTVVRRSARIAGGKTRACDGSRTARRSCATKVLYGKAEERVASESKQARTGGNTKSPARKKRVAKSVDCVGRTREKRKIGEGYGMVIGIDEAGRGPFAGPVVAAACCIPSDVNIPGIKDSKKVTELTDREALYTELTQAPGVRWATAVVDSQRIDEINILEATKEAMATCGLKLCADAPEGTKPFVFVDGNLTPPGLSSVDAECVIGGDGLEYCIAAASIIAKVTRDRMMIEFGKRWPVFGFEKHKGYGTQGHRDAIMQHGIVEIHRRSFLRKMEQELGSKLPLYESES